MKQNAVTIRPTAVQITCRLFFRSKQKRGTTSSSICRFIASIMIHFQSPGGGTSVGRRN